MLRKELFVVTLLACITSSCATQVQPVASTPVARNSKVVAVKSSEKAETKTSSSQSSQLPPPTKSEYEEQRTSTSQQNSRKLPPGCYVGPRGGTYTITKSGKKITMAAS